MSDIQRRHTTLRKSEVSIFNRTAYFAGQVGTPGESVVDQTREILDKLDQMLAEIGSDKTRLLQVTVCLADMSDFDEMNAVWDVWIPKGYAPGRACVEAKLLTPEHLVELIVIAAC